jgi:hypothetical protein
MTRCGRGWRHLGRHRHFRRWFGLAVGPGLGAFFKEFLVSAYGLGEIVIVSVLVVRCVRCAL